MEKGPPPPAEVASGRALPLRGPDPVGKGGFWFRGPCKEKRCPPRCLCLYSSTFPQPGSGGRDCHSGEAAVSFPEPHPRGPLPFAPRPPRREGLGLPPPEKAELKVREGQEGPGLPLVFFFGNPDQPPLPHPLKGIKASGISPPAPWDLLFSSPSFSHPPPRPRWHKR